MNLPSQELAKLQEIYSKHCSTSLTGQEYTYGHITHKGAGQMITILKTLDEQGEIRYQPSIDTFIDLGSGCGEFATYLWLSTGMNVRGVEISPERTEKANQSLSAVKAKLSSDLLPQSTISYQTGLAQEADLKNANYIYISNLLMPEAVTNKLFDRILNGEAPNLQVIFFSRQPTNLRARTASHFRHQMELVISQSWTENSTINLYVV